MISSSGKILVAVSAVVTGLVVSPTNIAAQDRGTDPQERTSEAYDQLGIRQGAFLILPSIELGTRYDDNLFAAETGERDDIAALVRPEVNVRSQWSQHALNLSAEAEIARYADFTAEDYEHYTLSSDGRVDISRQTNATARIRYNISTEERGSPDDVDGLTPTDTENLTIGGDLTHTFNRVSIQLNGEARDFEFDDVQTTTGTTNNDDRDRQEWTIGASLGYEISPRFQVFISGEYEEVDYQSALDDGGVNRDSDGFGVTGGLKFDITGVTQGDVGITYREQDYADQTLTDADAVGLDAGVTWDMTRLTRVRGTAGLSIDETTTAGASGIRTQRVGVTVKHELRRNILLNGGLNYSQGDYEGINREDETIGLVLGARYLLNRNFSVGLNGNFRDKDSNVANSSWKRNQVTLRLRAQL